jgi:type IV fimbrial biogenesis protein FimT
MYKKQGFIRFPRRPSWAVRGFTLIELMVVLGIVAVIVSFAAPSYETMTRSMRMRNAANDLLSAMAYARSEAIRRNAPVTVCSSTNGTSCRTSLGENFSNGWIVRLGGPTITGAAVILRDFPGEVVGQERVDMTANGGLNSISFTPVGITWSNFSGVRFTIQDASTNTAYLPQARVVCVTRGGRARVLSYPDWLNLPSGSDCAS